MKEICVSVLGPLYAQVGPGLPGFCEFTVELVRCAQGHCGFACHCSFQFKHLVDLNQVNAEEMEPPYRRGRFLIHLG
jgi:hypothetical protein